MKLVYKQDLDKDDGELDGYGAVSNTNFLLTFCALDIAKVNDRDNQISWW